MSYATDDLAPLFAQDKGGGLQFGKGVIVSYDPLTAENTVSFRGTTLHNLPILNGSEALTLTPGAIVGLLSTGGVDPPFILGRITLPNTPDAASALDMIRVYTADVETEDFQTDTNGAWVNLDTAGPTVTDVLISKSGRALVTISAEIAAKPGAPNTYQRGSMAFEISGATTRAPSEYATVAYKRPGGDSGQPGIDVSASRTVLVEGLNSGIHTFTAKYLVEEITDVGGSADIKSRNITVIPF